MDYSNSQILTLQAGKAKIQIGNFKIIHDINLQQFDKVIKDMTNTLQNDVTDTHPLFPFLNHELLQTVELLEDLKPRMVKKRSLNFIGSAWKWIAGNPDHEDFVTIKEKINNSLENSNKQVIINKLLTDRMNNLTKVTNNLQAFIKNNDNLKQNFVLGLQYRLRLVKEELVNIKHAIHWAKSGIVNTMLLSKNEIKLALNILDKENLPYHSSEEALEFAKVKVITDRMSLLYIVNIPITEKDTFDKLIVKPIRKNNIVTDIPYKEILKNKETFYAINGNCNVYNNLTICNQLNLLDLRNSSCIAKILNSLKPTCNSVNNQHIPKIDEIATGVLLLNDFNGTVDINNSSQILIGTFLLKFHNATITVEDKSFTSNETSNIEPMPAILQPTPYEKQLREVLSLEMINDLHINNTKQIQLLQNRSKLHEWTTYGFITMGIAGLILLFITKLIPRKQTIQISQPTENEPPITQQTTSILVPSFFDNSSRDNQLQRFYERPYF